MPAIITNKFRMNNAEQFEESFSESSPTVYYLGIGRAQEFGTLTRPDARTEFEGTELLPTTPGDSVMNEFKNYDDLLAAKKITGSNVSFVVPRRNWTTGTTYDIYRHDYEEFITGSTSTRQTANSGATVLFDSTFYVMTGARNVYKCLDNNGNSASTDEPTGTSTSVITTSDGYKWKYMYTLSASDQANFLSTDFMGVTTDSTVSAAAVDGSLDIVKIKSAGSSYTVSGGATSGTITAVPIRGDGTGGVASVTLTSGAITAVTITTRGSGYTFGYIRNADILAATNAGGAGSGAELDVIIPPKGGHGFNAVEELGGFFVMLNRDCSIHTDNYDAVGDGLPEATKRINIPIQNCEKTHTRWFIAHSTPDIAAYDGPNLTAPVAKPVVLDKMANPESMKSVIGQMQHEHKTGEKVFVPDGTHYNVFHEDEVTEVSRVELLKPTIIRVNEPHQVVIDKGWKFPRVAAVRK